MNFTIDLIIGILSIIFINIFMANFLYKRIDDIEKSSIYSCIISYFIFLYLIREHLVLDFAFIFMNIEIIFYFINKLILKHSNSFKITTKDKEQQEIDLWYKIIPTTILIGIVAVIVVIYLIPKIIK